MKKIISTLCAVGTSLCLTLSVSTMCLTVSAEEPAATSSAPYEVDDDIECTG